MPAETPDSPATATRRPTPRFILRVAVLPMPAALAFCSYAFCRARWDADLITALPLLMLFWYGLSYPFFRRWMWDPA